jgi:hypothetical protein
MKGFTTMRRIKIAALLSALMMLASAGLASAQTPAVSTPFATSITYQNVGNAQAQVQFTFYNELGTQTPVVVNRDIAAGAGSSLFVGGLTGTEQLPSGFQGSAVLSANQPIVATLVQIAQPSSGPNASAVKNRPLSNGFNTSASSVLLATVLKNTFNTTSVFSVQNAETNSAIDVTVTLFDAVNPANPPITIPVANIPVGSAKYFNMGTLSQVTANQFNGSARVTAVRANSSTPANIVASVMELSTNSLSAKAFEGVTSGGPTIYMATALCDAFSDQQRTAYAVQNNGNASANVTVTYSNNTAVTAAIDPGKKRSFIACDDGIPAGFNGASTITAPGGNIVVIGKVYANPAKPGFETAFLGEQSGAPKLALPYVRWTSQANFDSGARQRTFIAIQNVGASTVNNVQVKYLDKNGSLVGTHTIASIAPGAKANSTAPQAAPDPNNVPIALLEFGTPDGNPGGGFGGAVVVEAPGSQLIAIGTVASKVGAIQVAESYNGIPIN